MRAGWRRRRDALAAAGRHNRPELTWFYCRSLEGRERTSRPYYVQRKKIAGCDPAMNPWHSFVIGTLVLRQLKLRLFPEQAVVHSADVSGPAWLVRT